MIRPARVVVLGGGITGLVAAYRLTAAAGEGSPVAVTLVEASPGVGGKLRTGEVAGLQVETGPDSFVVRKPWAVDLCTQLGLGHDLIVPGASGAFVWARGRPVAFPRGTAFGVPGDVETILRWRGLSARGRIVAALEPLRGERAMPPDAAGEDESLRDLLVRRLGREAAEVLAGPVLAGIHAGDPARMSAAATFPELRAWEAGHGSLIRGARASIKAGRKQRSGPRPLFTTMDGGLDRLVDALVAELRPASVFTGTHVDRIGRAVEAAYVVKAGDRRILADAIVVAIPAAAASAALTAEAPLAASALRELRTVSTATVTLVYPEATADRLPDATGLIVPGGRAARAPGPRVVTACTWMSRKWPDASFGDRAVVRCFVGRDGEAAALELDDDDLASAVAADVELTTPIGAAPEARLVTRWPAGMPQYDVGHERRVQSAADALRAATPGIFLAGAAYGGIGIADCVRQGDEAAARVRAFLDERAQSGSNGRSEEATTRS